MGTEDGVKYLNEVIDSIWEQAFIPKVDITDVLCGQGIRYKTVPYGHRQDVFEDCSSWDIFKAGSSWGKPDGHVIFKFSFVVPSSMQDKEVFLFVSTGAEDIWNTDNPQMLIYVDGKRRSGMDMNHNCISIFSKERWQSLTGEGDGERTVDIGIYAYSNLSENGNLLNMEIAALNEKALAAYYDLKVPMDAYTAMAEIGDSHANGILDTLTRACDILKESQDQNKEYSEAELTKVSDYLDENLYGKGDCIATVASIGHTHIDVAWKWPLRQTREKVLRSFSTVLELMKRYPEYLFMSSTPQLYEMVREDEPELFEEILGRIKEKRFEPEGAMWLEADCNLTSGESLVRQIFYGKKYFKEMLGVNSTVLWLPDVFGYSAAMPQILKKSGIRAFTTTKVAWNDTNRLPYDLFMWEGIDGSRIPTYIISTCDLPLADKAARDGGILNYTYNGRQNATQVMGTYAAFREKNLTNEVLTCYGFGDGGGGPTMDMLEMDRRLRRGIPGVPRTVQKSVTGFFDDLLDRIKDAKDIPVWNDELYLEFHRGTYTSIGKNKRYNRKLEYLLKEAEIICLLAFLLKKREYPHKKLEELWKVLLLNQFHDILPGSSIEEVYTVSAAQYEDTIAEVTKLIGDNSGVFLESECALPGMAEGEDDRRPITVSTDKEGTLHVDTRFYDMEIDAKGEIVRLYDKVLKTEIGDCNAVPLNRLIAFEDKPKEYDCWNIDADFENVSFDVTDCSNMSVIGPDPVSGNLEITVERNFRNSKIQQTIVIKPDSRRIDFRTHADWHEHQTLLKAAFPVNVNADKITCEIQYGSIKRNLKKENSFDKAKFECCAHKWIDISDRDGRYGVALLNDCKYGYDSKEKLMRLTLIKSGIYPNPNADQGEHEFTYSLFPHEGDHVTGGVITQARRLNEDSHYILPVSLDDHKQALFQMAATPSEAVGKLVSGLISFKEADGIFVEAVKKAEDNDDVIIRFYEGNGQGRNITAKLFGGYDLEPVRVCECDLLEKECDTKENFTFDRDNKELSLWVGAYEIKTIRISMQKMQSF